MRHKYDCIALIVVINAFPQFFGEEFVAGLGRMLKTRHIWHFAESDLQTLLLLTIILDKALSEFGVGLGQVNTAEHIMTSDAVVDKVQLVGLKLLQYNCLSDEL